MPITRSQKGFTLVEMVIYAAILATVSVLAVNAILSMTRTLGVIRSEKSLGNSAEVALERMAREIRLASSIDALDSVLGTSPGRLTLNTIDPVSESSRKISFFVDGGSLAMSIDGGASYALTGSGVSVTRLVFYRVTNASSSQAVKIEADLAAGSGADLHAATFYDTAVLRRSY